MKRIIDMKIINKNPLMVDRLKVKDLIKILQTIPPEDKVKLSSDEEQNSVSVKICFQRYKGELVLLPLDPGEDN